MTRTALVWFRRDLRCHDNPTLAAAAEADELLPVYCFDPRAFGKREYGGPNSFSFEKTGGHRTRFLTESVADLRERLREHGCDLLVREGKPEDVLPELAAAHDADELHCSTYPTSEEKDVESAVTAALSDEGVEVQSHWGHTLYHVDDLPTDPRVIDDTFTPFRKAVEAESTVRDPLPEPALPPLPVSVGDDTGEVPTAPFGTDPATADDRGALPFAGGEGRAIDRVEEYIWEGDHLREYKETRNGLVGADYSSKFSPWLALGCLSPRYVHDEVRRYEAERVANDSTYWLLFELCWRDFFQFQFVKHGNQHFRREGIRNRTDVTWLWDDRRFRLWATGQTGIPFVDAAMRELNETGYVSNRARQNAASFLANNLRLDWRHGAAYFETKLLDYDPCSNYGNWAYIAGVGNDSRDRQFDIVWQANRYDPDAAYVKRWIPALEPFSAEEAHEPWTIPRHRRRDHGLELGTDYPEPMVRLERT
ncbi:DASH family cryptochrome [Haloarchaeobius amylolyticus]|uniref:DASH family cryptochrome n=1 Tax=Haloarchaeobius amylolyticus TaxID=1198296 RepID=UPI002270622B|nr:DASH family cryptochrome [Haloarchaeobius amylolyticus]